MRRLTKLGGMLVLWLACAMPAHAQRLTLDEAMDYARSHSPDVTASSQRTLAAAARTRAARGERGPTLGFNYTLRTGNNPLDAFADKLNARGVAASDFDPAQLNHPGTSTLNMAQLSAQWPLYTGGRLRAELRAAQAAEHASTLDLDRRREDVAARAANAYLDAQAAQAQLAIADDAVAAARRHADTTRALVAQGRIVPSDALTAQVYLAGVESRRVQARTQVDLSLDRLKLAMGMPLDASVEIAPMSASPVVDTSAPLSALEANALATRRDLAALRLTAQSRLAGVDAARAQDKPQISLNANTTWYDDTGRSSAGSWSVMGVVRQSLYDGAVADSRAAAARYEAQAAQAQVAGLEQAIRNDVRQALAMQREALARRAIALDNVTRAHEAVRLIRKRYGEGRTILIDLLQAERALVDARREALAASLDLAKAQIALKLAEGTL